MIVEERRFEVRLISPDALRQYMKCRGYTVRSLATIVGCSHSTIGFLLTGTIKTVRPEWAKAIAKALDRPVDALFVPKVSMVRREVGPKGRAAPSRRPVCTESVHGPPRGWTERPGGMKAAVWVSTGEAARQLAVSVPTIRGLITDGQLEAWPQQTVTGNRIHAWKVSQASIDSYPRRARLAAS